MQTLIQYYNGYTGDNLFYYIQLSCKQIYNEILKYNLHRNSIDIHTGLNKSGDIQQKLDVISNSIFINNMKESNLVAGIISEENNNIIKFNEHTLRRWVIACDPLDGSSNIDCNIGIGTIFGIYHRGKFNQELSDVSLPKGDDLFISGYCIYSTVIELIISTNKVVNRFTLDTAIGEFVLSQKQVRIPSIPKQIYSVNEGNYSKWDNDITIYIDQCKFNKSYSLRYIGSMVADIHRTLLYGGIFLYPSDNKNKNGKLRLMYEAHPIAKIIETAGGKAITNNKKRLLDIIPTSIHERIPVFIGSCNDINSLNNIL